MTINFFVVTRHVVLDPAEFALPAFGSKFYIVEFTVRNLEDPSADPIGLYSYYGTRRYLWRDKIWGEYNLPHRMVSERTMLRLRDCIDKNEVVRLQTLFDILKDYSKSFGPTNNDMIDNPITYGKVFCRAIYEINGG